MRKDVEGELRMFRQERDSDPGNFSPSSGRTELGRGCLGTARASIFYSKKM